MVPQSKRVIYVLSEPYMIRKISIEIEDIRKKLIKFLCVEKQEIILT
jgi:hypothetical protein